ncbi:two-component sensor histidine kinase [Arcanobacterium pluranimalium]|uniref:histidine kinase N-terminal domain-containing protein n=1 Tax=Arcanobacterium pluranimalium TaxID=108028 RepID=UPI00195924A1|nr:two-component sensor histidine kinase [Arcanobacterium pluranimalium]
MPTLTKILERTERFTEDERKWFHQLAGDWQTIADISFADLLLYVPTDDGFITAAHARPATAATLIETDIVGEKVDGDSVEHVYAVFNLGEMIVSEDSSVSNTFIPVRHCGKIIGVVRVISALLQDRVPSQAQQNYEEIAQDLFEMIASGDFPLEGMPAGFRHGTPRVSDGVIQLDDDGEVLYASPNSVSHFRRLGVDEPLIGNILAETVTDIFDDFSIPEESLPLVLLGKAAWVAEIDAHGVIVSLRALPLIRKGERVGALLMTREITELRRQERELLTKDATIREINHRVKNNLQTVSALLRLQARRAVNDETRVALGQAQRRVGMIALVHEGLSQTIDEVVEFDSVFGSLLKMVRDIAVTESAVDISLNGSFGKVRAEQATSLAVVLNEVISNAIEHGLVKGGKVEVNAERLGERLFVQVRDNGSGISEQGPGGGLGTQIVKTLVNGELNGTIEWSNNPDGGTLVSLELKLR